MSFLSRISNRKVYDPHQFRQQKHEQSVFGKHWAGLEPPGIYAVNL
jgi:hypothetical protein